MICSVLSKWQFYFYLSAHSDFGFFSCVGYLHPKLHIKGVKNPFLNFVGYMKSRLLLEGLLRYLFYAFLFQACPRVNYILSLKPCLLLEFQSCTMKNNLLNRPSKRRRCFMYPTKFKNGLFTPFM